MDEKTRAHVERVVAEAPPLTEEQRARLARLLQPEIRQIIDYPARLRIEVKR